MIRFDMRPSNEQPPFTEIAKESLELIFKAAPDDNGLGMKILKSLYGYIYEGNEPDNLNEVESLVYFSVASQSKRRYEAWLNKTKNFREHNPRKEAEVEPQITVDNG